MTTFAATHWTRRVPSELNFPTIYIFIILLLSIILIASYPYFLAGNAEYLWGPIKGNLRKLYYVSIFLVLLGFIPFAYFLLTCQHWSQKEVTHIFYAFLTLIIASWLWIIFAVMYAKKSANLNLLRFIIVVTLLIVSLSILYMMYILRNHKPLEKETLLKIMIYIGLGYGFFHTFFMDFILWAYLVLFRR
jgi:hypothetical protein